VITDLLLVFNRFTHGVLMKWSIFILCMTALMWVAAPVLADPSFSAPFIDTEGNKIGAATFQDMTHGTLITIDVDLPEGPHALHIHENGDCVPPDFKTAGGHFNPKARHHGFASHAGFHAGDLPNLYVESTGHIKAEIFTTQVPYISQKKLGQGLSIIIHEKADDYSTDPTGNAGARIACAVIKP